MSHLFSLQFVPLCVSSIKYLLLCVNMSHKWSFGPFGFQSIDVVQLLYPFKEIFVHIYKKINVKKNVFVFFLFYTFYNHFSPINECYLNKLNWLDFPIVH